MTTLLVKARLHKVPAHATIELLGACNLRCGHCYVSRDKPARLTTTVLTNIFDELAAAGTFSLSLTGGEIGLRNDLFDIIRAARNRRFAVTLLTSGTLWGPPEWRQIAALAVDVVQVSLYSANATRHDRITGVPGSHAKTMATVRGLTALGVRMSLAHLAMSRNSRDLAEVLALATDLGASVVVDANLTSTDRGGTGPLRYAASSAELICVFHSKEASRHHLETTPSERPPMANDRPCAVGESSLFVDSEGQVFPCINWPTPAGSIFSDGILDIWRNSPVFAQVRSISFADVERCAACQYAVGCRPCVAMNIRDNGELGAPSATVCRSAAAMATIHKRR